PIHTGHAHVEEDTGGAGERRQFQRLLAVPRWQHLISLIVQGESEKAPDTRLILRDNDSWLLQHGCHLAPHGVCGRRNGAKEQRSLASLASRLPTRAWASSAAPALARRSTAGRVARR